MILRLLDGDLVLTPGTDGQPANVTGRIDPARLVGCAIDHCGGAIRMDRRPRWRSPWNPSNSRSIYRVDGYGPDRGRCGAARAVSGRSQGCPGMGYSGGFGTGYVQRGIAGSPPVARGIGRASRPRLCGVTIARVEPVPDRQASCDLQLRAWRGAGASAPAVGGRILASHEQRHPVSETPPFMFSARLGLRRVNRAHRRSRSPHRRRERKPSHRRKNLAGAAQEYYIQPKLRGALTPE